MINLTTLDLSSNTTITDNYLDKLTNLKQLSLSGNKVIINQGISLLLNLTELNVSYSNNITDVKHLTNLTKLEKHRNYAI